MNNSIVSLIVLLLVTLLNPTKAASQTFVTTSRQISTSWSTTTGCVTDYFYINAYEPNSRVNGQGNGNQQPVEPAVYLYYERYSYNSCNFTWHVNWASKLVPVSGLTIDVRGRSANLYITGLIDSDNHNVTINLAWHDINSNNACSCRYNEHAGPLSGYKSVTHTSYTITSITGTVSENNTVYTPTSGANGYIYDYGSKTVTISHL